ncbi:MAG: precorrin-4 C(11)-methyltransferase [Chloroflexi bacterium]|nr:precorrin-4 C(11)-methyltransferase [Chloroflexota bacterium]
MTSGPKVYFIGAGPGDPELLTLKGKRIIEQADVIIYADSLVDQHICDFASQDAEIRGSSSLTLEQITALMVGAVRAGKTVARVHTGDPSLFGALGEQMAVLDTNGIPYEVVPGVSSIFAASAALGVELTVPEVSQTVIITRLEGRTPVPAKEALSRLAEHQATLVLFLSVGMVDAVVERLLAGGYAKSTPVAVVQRASWEDQRIVRGTLDDIAGKVRAAGIKSQALILVGDALALRHEATPGDPRSRLYDGSFGHQYRKANDGG